MSETAIATSRAIVTIALVLTPDQREEAARQLRALDGDDITRKLFDDIADSLELHNRVERERGT